MANMETYKISCFIPGNKNIFTVDVEKTQDVHCLKKLIRAEKPQTFANVDIVLDTSALCAGSTPPQGFGLPDPPQKSITKPLPQLNPVRVFVKSSPSVRCHNLMSGGQAK